MESHEWNITPHYSTGDGFEFELICDATGDKANQERGFCQIHKDRRLTLEDMEQIITERDALMAQVLFYKFDDYDKCDWKELSAEKQEYWLDLVEQDKATRKKIEDKALTGVKHVR